jgi:peroxiredoxin
MFSRSTRITAILLACLCCQGFTDAGKKVVSDFVLQNVDGRTVSTKDYKDAKGFVVVFTCIHCPFAKLYHERLNQLNAKYSKLHVPLLLINSSDTIMFANESLPNMAKVAREKKYASPYLFDPSQAVAKNFKAEKTPHAFVIWKENSQWVIKYSGAIDDNGAHPELVKTPYIANAIDELISGKPVSIAEGYSIGCAIHYRKF